LGRCPGIAGSAPTGHARTTSWRFLGHAPGANRAGSDGSRHRGSAGTGSVRRCPAAPEATGCWVHNQAKVAVNRNLSRKEHFQPAWISFGGVRQGSERQLPHSPWEIRATSLWQTTQIAGRCFRFPAVAEIVSGFPRAFDGVKIRVVRRTSATGDLPGWPNGSTCRAEDCPAAERPPRDGR